MPLSELDLKTITVVCLELDATCGERSWDDRWCSTHVMKTVQTETEGDVEVTLVECIFKRCIACLSDGKWWQGSIIETSTVDVECYAPHGPSESFNC